VNGAPRITAIKAGGAFGILAAFLAWYNAFAGIADSSNRYAYAPNFMTIDILTYNFTASSSSQLYISHGQTRAANDAAKSAMKKHALSKLYNFGKHFLPCISIAPKRVGHNEAG
jgi:hypothetical protein